MPQVYHFDVYVPIRCGAIFNGHYRQVTSMKYQQLRTGATGAWEQGWFYYTAQSMPD